LAKKKQQIDSQAIIPINPFCVPSFVPNTIPLNHKLIESLQATGAVFEQADRNGLIIRVSPNGQKTLQYRYRLSGRARRMKIGVFPETSLKDARARHLERAPCLTKV
jgi:hypothetical protein